MKVFYTIFVCLLWGMSLGAQVKIDGSLYSQENEALPYANVRLLHIDSTFVSGTITDSLGYYYLDQVPSNDYLLAFSTIGYKSKVIPVTVRNEDVTVPTVTLESDNVILGEVIIKGSSFIRQKDRVLIIPDKQHIKHANTGYDLLYNLMIPDIEVNRKKGEVSNGLGTVTLYINGEKADYRDVQSLRPRDIEKVEYFDVPTGRYSSDIAAINYITKQYRSGGYVSLDGQQTIGYLNGDYNVSAKVSHGNTSYTLWGGYAMKKYEDDCTEKHESIFFPGYEIDREHTSSASRYKNNQQYVQFKVSNVTKKHNLSAQAAFVRDDTPENGSEALLAYSGYYNRQVSSFDAKDENNLKPSLRLYGNFELPKGQNLEFTLKGSYGRNTYTRTYQEADETSLSDVNEDLYSFNFFGKYNLPLRHNNSFGVDIRHIHDITSSDYKGDYDSWQHLWMSETMLHVSYNQRFGEKFSLDFRPGVSMVNYKLHGLDGQQHWSIRLRSQFVYHINKQQQLAFIANIANEQPEISYMNNIDQTVDFIQIKRGNPYLDNTKYYDIGMIYNLPINRFNAQLMMVWGFADNNIRTHYYIEEDKLVSSFLSNSNAYNLGARLALSYKFSDHLRAKFTGQYVNVHVTNLSMNQNGFLGILDVNYFLKDFALNVYGRTASSQLDMNSLVTVKEPASYGASVSWSHKGWYLEAGTENPFTKHVRYKEHADYGVYKYSQVRTSRINQQTGYVKVAYTFDFGRKTSRDKNDVDRTINSAIMKVN